MDNIFLTDAGIKEVAGLFSVFPRPSSSIPDHDDPQWYSAFLRGDLSRALQELETGLAQGANGLEMKNLETSRLELRLWWIYCQLVTDAVPVSALSAPLEDMMERLRENTEFLSLGAITYVCVALKCLERNQLRLGVLLLERALELVMKDKSSTTEQCRGLVDLLCCALQDESRRAEVRRESKGYLADLKEKLGTYSNPKFLSSRSPEKSQRSDAMLSKEARGKATTKKRVFNSKSIIEQAIAQPKSKVPAAASSSVTKSGNNPELKFKELTLDEVASEKPELEKMMIMGERIRPEMSSSHEVPAKQTVSNATKVFGLIIAVGCLLYIFIWKGSFLSVDQSEEMKEHLALRIDSSTKLEQILPVVNLRLTASSTSETQRALSLDEVKQRLDSLGSQRRDRQASSTASLDSLQKNPEVDQVALKAGEQLLKSPQNGAQKDPETLAQVFDGAQDDEKKMPDLTPERLEKTEQHSLDPQSVGQEGHITTGVTRNSDHRSNSSLPNLPSSGPAVALDGTPLRAYPVEQFGQPLPYQVIVSTDVYSSPSIRARPVEHLERGDKVDVIARLGPWLELLSVRGRRGYIYAQNAVGEGRQ